MSKENKSTSEKDSDKEFEKKKRKMDNELRQTFPASDPPSHSRPGHERTVDDDDDS